LSNSLDKLLIGGEHATHCGAAARCGVAGAIELALHGAGGQGVADGRGRRVSGFVAIVSLRTVVRSFRALASGKVDFLTSIQAGRTRDSWIRFL